MLWELQAHYRAKLLALYDKQYVLGYPTSVVEGVGDEFISVRESLIS